MERSIDSNRMIGSPAPYFFLVAFGLDHPGPCHLAIQWLRILETLEGKGPGKDPFKIRRC